MKTQIAAALHRFDPHNWAIGIIGIGTCFNPQILLNVSDGWRSSLFNLRHGERVVSLVWFLFSYIVSTKGGLTLSWGFKRFDLI